MGVRFTTRALLLRATTYGERDSIVTLFTEDVGKLAAVVRGARAGPKKFGGAIEPIHTIRVALEEGRGDLASMREAEILSVRAVAASKLETIEAGGVALRWARHIFPLRTPEPLGWEALLAFLDALDREPVDVPVELVKVGMRLLQVVGYALDLDACVVCRRPCPDGRSAYVSVQRGGLVCQTCGGGERMLDAESMRAARALLHGEAADAGMSPKTALAIRSLIDDAMVAHADYSP